ncbi:MAG TPA: multidrug effflux MFS transporter [Alphaproteobacteria bacterium]|nr:multidrug effflux MFS transporter [Alphaproteobacteria bacterium]
MGALRVRLILVLGALAALGPLAIDMYLPAFPTLARHFGVEPGAVQATLSAYFAGLAIGQAFCGPLADRFGRKGPLLAGLALFALASAAAAWAPGAGALVGLRFVQAVGGCVGMVVGRAVVRDLFDERESAKVFSRMALVMGVAPILAPLLGGQMLLLWGWQSIFLALGAFGLFCLAAVQLQLPETLPRDRRFGGSPLQVLGVYAGLLADRRFLGFALTFGMVFASLFAYIAGSAFVFITIYGVSAQDFGWLFGANAAGLIAATQVNVRLLRRWTGRQVLAAALVAGPLFGAAMVAAAATGFGGLPGILAPLFLMVTSFGLIMGNCMAAAMASARSNAGAASALVGILQFVCGGISSALVGLLQDGTALPMAAVSAGCILAALAFHRLMAVR